MKITKVTMTGADDSVTPESLIELSNKYPFVEWGILFSQNRFGSNRFPSVEWLSTLQHVSDGRYFSAHFCGHIVNETLYGGDSFIKVLGSVWGIFQRVQINTHGIEHAFKPNSMVTLLNSYPEKQYIFQYDNQNVPILAYSSAMDVNCAALFDMSHGAGILPEEWPQPLDDVPCGYAGGLSPENIKEQLDLLNSVLPDDLEIWIDMETHIRSNNDIQFDLNKVETVLKICKESGYLKV